MKNQDKTHVIDATNKRMGVLASNVAQILMGKSDANFARNVVHEVKVKIEHAGKLDISGKKKEQTLYASYSGYPGGLRRENMAHLIGRKGYREALRIAIYGMLPKNNLRDRRIKNLTISE